MIIKRQICVSCAFLCEDSFVRAVIVVGYAAVIWVSNDKESGVKRCMRTQMMGGGGTRRSEFPSSPTSYSRFPPPSLLVPASVCFFYHEILCNVVKFISYFSQLPPPWVSRLLPSLLPPPVHFPPPLLPGSHPPVLLHNDGCAGDYFHQSSIKITLQHQIVVHTILYITLKAFYLHKTVLLCTFFFSDHTNQ